MGVASWELSFSFGRALQAPALQVWGGERANAGAAQTALRHRVLCNREARFGRYTNELEEAGEVTLDHSGSLAILCESS